MSHLETSAIIDISCCCFHMLEKKFQTEWHCGACNKRQERSKCGLPEADGIMLFVSLQHCPSPEGRQCHTFLPWAQNIAISPRDLIRFKKLQISFPSLYEWTLWGPWGHCLSSTGFHCLGSRPALIMKLSSHVSRCPAFAQELLLNWGSCSWCLPELCGRFSCAFFHDFLTSTHRSGFQAWAGTPSRPILAVWVSGDPDPLHPPSSAHLVGSAFLGWGCPTVPAAPCRSIGNRSRGWLLQNNFLEMDVSHVLQVYSVHMFMLLPKGLSFQSWHTI